MFEMFTRRATHEVPALLTSVKYSSYQARKKFLKTASSTAGPGKNQRVGYHVFTPVALGSFSISFPTFSGIYTARAPLRAVGCTSVCLDKKVCRLNVPVLVSFHVLLVFCRSDQPAAIGRVRHLSPHRVLRLRACAKTKPHGSSILPRFLGSRKAATLKSPPMMSTQFSSAISWPHPAKIVRFLSATLSCCSSALTRACLCTFPAWVFA